LAYSGKSGACGDTLRVPGSIMRMTGIGLGEVRRCTSLGAARVAGQLDAESSGSNNDLAAMDEVNSKDSSTSRIRAALLVTIMGALVVCVAVAAMTANLEASEDIGSEVGASAPRRASSINATTNSTDEDKDGYCHTVNPSDQCWEHVYWAMTKGINSHPEWYPGLVNTSRLEEFQMLLHQRVYAAGCPRPCGMSYWCTERAPKESWDLKSCTATGSTQHIRVLTYNLFWWNLFDIRHGNNGSVGRLIHEASHSEGFDVMAFQEAGDIWWPLGQAGLKKDEHDQVQAHGLAVVWRPAAWKKLANGLYAVAEDTAQQHYGKRYIIWVRLQNSLTNRTMLFANTHGPLPVGTGGLCGGNTTGSMILGLLKKQKEPEDLIVLTGDFNAGHSSDTFRTLSDKIHHIFTGQSFGGIDHFFSNCAGDFIANTTNLGSGGSDHDALTVTWNV